MCKIEGQVARPESPDQRKFFVHSLPVSGHKTIPSELVRPELCLVTPRRVSFLIPYSATINAESDSGLKWSMALRLPSAQQKTVPDHLRLDRRRGVKPWGRLAKAGIGTKPSFDVKLHLGSDHANKSHAKRYTCMMLPSYVNNDVWGMSTAFTSTLQD